MKKFWIKYSGPSMYPLLKDEDQILIEVADSKLLQKGDIVLFFDRQSSELTLHRLVDFPFLTKGDFSLCMDESLMDSILGRAIGFERGDFYRKIPKSGVFVALSKLRMRGYFLRKFALVMLFLVSCFFGFYSNKTRLNHNREQMLNDPLSHA